MRKRTSKRRWIAKFNAGKLIPYTVLIAWPELKQRLSPSEESGYSSHIRKLR